MKRAITKPKLHIFDGWVEQSSERTWTALCGAAVRYNVTSSSHEHATCIKCLDCQLQRSAEQAASSASVVATTMRRLHELRYAKEGGRDG